MMMKNASDATYDTNNNADASDIEAAQRPDEETGKRGPLEKDDQAQSNT